MTPDALLALLRANPEAAVAAIPQFRVAGPWEFEAGRYGNHRWFRRGVYPARDVLVVTVVFADAGLVDRIVGVTHEGWWLIDAPPVPFATAEEAKAAADERMAGWVLGGDTPAPAGRDRTIGDLIGWLAEQPPGASARTVWWRIEDWVYAPFEAEVSALAALAEREATREEVEAATAALVAVLGADDPKVVHLTTLVALMQPYERVVLPAEPPAAGQVFDVPSLTWQGDFKPIPGFPYQVVLQGPPVPMLFGDGLASEWKTPDDMPESSVREKDGTIIARVIPMREGGWQWYVTALGELHHAPDGEPARAAADEVMRSLGWVLP